MNISPCVCGGDMSVSPVLGTTVGIGVGVAVGRNCTVSIR